MKLNFNSEKIQLTSLQARYSHAQSSNRMHAFLPIVRLFESKKWDVEYAVFLTALTLPVIPLTATIGLTSYGLFGHTKTARIQPIEALLNIIQRLEQKPTPQQLDRISDDYLKARDIIKSCPSKQGSDDYRSLVQILETLDNKLDPIFVKQKSSILENDCGLPNPIADIVISYRP